MQTTDEEAKELHPVTFDDGTGSHRRAGPITKDFRPRAQTEPSADEDPEGVPAPDVTVPGSDETSTPAAPPGEAGDEPGGAGEAETTQEPGGDSGGGNAPVIDDTTSVALTHNHEGSNFRKKGECPACDAARGFTD